MFGILSFECIMMMMVLGVSSQQPEAPTVTRTVKDNVLTSTEKPAVRLRFDNSFQYIGSQAFILYGVATAEQHFFIDADTEKKIRRFYWVQFEGYLPSNTHSYRYNSKSKANIGPLEFIADAAPRKINPQGRPDSDSAKAHAFFASKGYKMASSEVLTQRLVHLLDEKKRDELMIIYAEDLSPTKLTAADLAPGGKAADQWEGMARDLMQRTLKGITVVKN